MPRSRSPQPIAYDGQIGTNKMQYRSGFQSVKIWRGVRNEVAGGYSGHHPHGQGAVDCFRFQPGAVILRGRKAQRLQGAEPIVLHLCPDAEFLLFALAT